MRAKKTAGAEPGLRVPGLTDRSERPTTHALFAPKEREKEREEQALRKRFRRTSRGKRRPSL